MLIKKEFLLYLKLFCTAYSGHIKMITCKICSKTCSNILAYVRHMRSHTCMPNVPFKCGFLGCSRAFSTFSAFKCHSYRHKVMHRTDVGSVTDLSCHVDFCSAKCEDIVFSPLWKLISKRENLFHALSTNASRALQLSLHLHHICQEGIKIILKKVWWPQL